MLANARQFVEPMIDGHMISGHFRKSCGLVSVAGSWVDFSMTSGNPPGNYYASTPLVAERLDPWSGIFHGANQNEKYIAELMLCTPSSGLLGVWWLMDYLLYYPFIDLDDTSASQEMNNTKSLDRYESGANVMAMLVAQSPTTGGGTFNFTYINQDGVEKTSPTQTCSSSSTNYGTVITHLAATTSRGPWLVLAGGDTGIRRILTFTNLVANGGLGAVVLVKPLATIVLSEINAPVEVSFLVNNPTIPRVYPNAYLNYLCCTGASVAALS